MESKIMMGLGDIISTDGYICTTFKNQSDEDIIKYDMISLIIGQFGYSLLPSYICLYTASRGTIYMLFNQSASSELQINYA